MRPPQIHHQPRPATHPSSLSDLGRPVEESGIRAKIFMRLRNMVNTNDENGGKFWPKSRFPQPGEISTTGS
jgi:hypothetical protein